jgi:hypothetical protein
MRSIFVIAAPVFLLVEGSALAQEAVMPAAPAVTVLATHPDSDATLHSSEAFYIQYKIESTVPVGVRPEGYYRGKPLPLANSGERQLPAGGGTDAAFIFMFPKQPVQMDELRLVVTEAGKRQPMASFSVPVNLSWGTAPATAARTVPGWVSEWSARRNREAKSQIDTRMQRADAASTPLTVVLMAGLGLLVLALMVGGFVLPIIAFLNWEGGWRVGALVPVPILGFVVLRVLIDGAADPTSHNLWPFEILLWGVPSVLYLGVLWLLRLPKRAASGARDEARGAMR